MGQDAVEFLKTDLSIIFIVIGILVGMGIERFRSEMRRRTWRERNRWKSDPPRQRRRRLMQPTNYESSWVLISNRSRS